MMGAQSSGKQKLNKLIDSLVHSRVITTPKVAQIMRKVDRGDFCPSYYAYEDSPQSISYNATISAPHMHAYCLEWLKDVLLPGSRVLDVGCGSGYLCAAFYEMMEGQGKVVGIEHIDQLCQSALDNLNKNYGHAVKDQTIEVVCGDGRLGYEKHSPYNAIHVGAAAETIPQALVEQLALGGRLVIPVGPSGSQEILMISKDGKGNLSQKSLLGVRYIPLTNKEYQCPDLYHTHKR